jgi:threonine/homoserine/homoserine lactone efflux protein
MAPEEPGPTLGYRLRHGLKTHRAMVSAFVLGVGILLTVLAVGAFTPLRDTAPFPTINAATDTSAANYNLLFIVLGPIVVIVGAYLVGVYAHARHRFEHLMLTKSKAEFLRNIPEMEELLWDLTPVDEQRYETRRGELHLRR